MYKGHLFLGEHFFGVVRTQERWVFSEGGCNLPTTPSKRSDFLLIASAGKVSKTNRDIHFKLLPVVSVNSRDTCSRTRETNWKLERIRRVLGNDPRSNRAILNPQWVLLGTPNDADKTSVQMNDRLYKKLRRKSLSRHAMHSNHRISVILKKTREPSLKLFKKRNWKGSQREM